LPAVSGLAALHTLRDFGKRIKPKKIGVIPLYPRSINPYIHLITALDLTRLYKGASSSLRDEE
jgi:hypothetical protein